MSLFPVPDFPLAMRQVWYSKLVADSSTKKPSRGLIVFVWDSGANHLEMRVGDGVTMLKDLVDLFSIGATIDWSNVLNTPTTLAGYGITDGLDQTTADGLYAALSHTHVAADITDFNTAGDAQWAQLLHASQHQHGGSDEIAISTSAANAIPKALGTGKLDTSWLPDSVLGQLEYQGAWDAATNTPAIPTASSAKGHYYVASSNVAIGHGYSNVPNVDFKTGDWIVSNGTTWDKIDNSDAVVSFNSRIGAILPAAGDYTATQVTNTSTVTGTWVSDALDWLLNNRQPLAAILTNISGLSAGANRFIYFDGTATATMAAITAQARALLDDASASDQRTTIGAAPNTPTYILQTANSELTNAQVLASLTSGILKSQTVTGIISIASAGTDYYAPGSTDVAVTDGGTGASTQVGARTNLGLGTVAVLDTGTSASNVPTITIGDARYILNSLVTTKGDIIAATASATPARVAAGTNGNALIADNTQTEGVRYANVRALLLPMFYSIGSGQVWTNMPAAVTWFNGATTGRPSVPVPLSEFTQGRVCVLMNNTAGAATPAKIIMRYRSTYSATASDYLVMGAGSTEIALAINFTSAYQVGAWTDLTSAAQNDVFVALLGIDGDGATDPNIGAIWFEFR